MSIRFEWDPSKALANKRKHGISFEAAALAFTDAFAFSELEGFTGDEPRWRTIGAANGLTLLLVVHTDWDDDGVEVVRIISARPTTRQERKRYEENLRKIRN